MPPSRYPVQVVNQAGQISQGVFLLDDKEGTDACHLRFQYADSDFQAEAADYFAALCQVRDQLESLGLYAICYGSSRCVYPSGMCRDMGRGLKAYKLQLGRHAKSDDLVGILETGPDVEPVSVNEQQAFFECWLKSERH